MADLDDDLLDLAGGSSGDEGSGNESRDRSLSPEPVRRKDGKKAPAKKAKKRSRQDESEEEGEA
jgi:RNA polymerase-associated protein RTF1